MKSESIKQKNTVQIITAVVGVFFGMFSGINHGIFEILQGNRAAGGLLISAIGEGQRFWSEGHEPAFTVIPNYMMTGIFSIIIGAAIVIWSIWFLNTKYGSTVYIGLFILSFLAGGGIGQVFFFVPAWIFSTRMNKPLHWWRKVLPPSIRPFLSKFWIISLVTAILFMIITLEIAIFGLFPGVEEPLTIQNISMGFFFASIVLFIVTFIAGIGNELLKMDRSRKEEVCHV